MFNPFAPMPRYAKSHLHWSCCEAFPSPRARLQVTEFVQWHRDLASCDMLRWALVVICANCLYLGRDIAYILLLSLEIFGGDFVPHNANQNRLIDHVSFPEPSQVGRVKLNLHNMISWELTHRFCWYHLTRPGGYFLQNVFSKSCNGPLRTQSAKSD